MPNEQQNFLNEFTYSYLFRCSSYIYYWSILLIIIISDNYRVF